MESSGKLADPNSALEKMREAASEMGGDALTEFGVEDVPDEDGHSRVSYAAKVIVFETPASQ